MPDYGWPEPVASPEEWRQLLIAAEAFKTAQPWAWMLENMLFAVQNPETGEVGFCSITGQLGQHFALIVYLGEGALGNYLSAVHGIHAVSFLEEREHGMLLLEAPQLQASFKSPQAISAMDRQLVKAAKVRIRGRDLWPAFRSLMPGRAPWYLTRPQVRFLTVLLEQAQILAEMQLRENMLGFQGGDLPKTLRLLSRVYAEGAWSSVERTFMPRYPVFLAGAASADLAAVRRQLPLQDVQLQVHLALTPVPVQEGPLPPYLPYTLLAVDAESGMVVGAELLLAQPTLADLWPQVLPKLLEIFGRLQARPKRIQLVSERLYHLLAAPLGELGVKLTRTRTMPALEEALLDFEDWLATS